MLVVCLDGLFLILLSKSHTKIDMNYEIYEYMWSKINLDPHSIELVDDKYKWLLKSYKLNIKHQCLEKW